MTMKLLVVISCALGVSHGAMAQEFPVRPISMILPVSAGGPTDIGARTYGPYIAKCLGPQANIAVVNMPGGNAVIALSEVAASEPDGYTFGSLNTPNLITSTIGETRPYDVDSFVYFGSIVGSTSAFAVAQDSDIESIDDLVERANNGNLLVGVGTIGSDDHLSFLRFARIADVDLNFIPFGDEAMARNALLGGNVDVIGMSATAALTYGEDLRLIGVGSAERLDYVPEVPTFTEAGYPLISGSIHALGAPAGLPDDIVTKMRQCVQDAASDPEFLAEAEQRSIALNVMTAEEVEGAISAEEADLQAIWEQTPWRQ